MIPTIPTIKDRRRTCIQQASWNAESTAYFAALGTNGVTVLLAQRNGFNTFITAGKNGGWLSKIQRLYLPVWGAAAPNALNALSPGSSGTWVGTLSYAGSQVQSTGGNGYFATGFNASGYAPAEVGLFAVAPTIDPAGVLIGARNTNDLLLDNYSSRSGWVVGAPASATFLGYSGMHIRLGYGTGSVTKIARLAPGGSALTIENSYTPTGSVPNAEVYAMAFNFGGPALYNVQPFYGFGVIGGALTDAQASSFAVALDRLITALRA